MSFLFQNLVIPALRFLNFSKIFAKTGSRKTGRKIIKRFWIGYLGKWDYISKFEGIRENFSFNTFVNSLVNSRAKMHFESFTNFRHISFISGVASELTLSIQEMTSSSHISRKANDCTQLLVKILKELLVCGILFTKLVGYQYLQNIHMICRKTQRISESVFISGS